MTSPGGAEVGRVSVRVLPNTDGFRERARAGLERELANLEVTVKVEPDLDNFNERVRAELARLQAESAKVQIELQLDENQIRERLRAIVNGAQAGIVAEIEIQWVPANAILKAQLRAKVLAAQAGIRAEVDVNFNVDRNRIQQAVAGAGGGGGGGLFDLPNVVTRWATIITLLGPLILAAGAAITEAWAAVSAAILAIPPLVALIGVPILGIVLGIGGIQEAFKNLQPIIDQIRNQLANTFIKTLDFAYLNLKFLLEKIRDSRVAEGLAQSISVVMIEISQVLNNNAQKIVDIIAVISNRFQEMGPAIAGFVDSILQILAVPNALDAIATPIELFLEKWRTMVDELNKDGTLQEVFKGLASVLGSLSRALVDLINNGVKVFETSWPGFDQFIRGITEFFNKFDWERLGKAVGDTLGGIGEALKNIDPAVIEELTSAFEAVGLAFQEQGFQDSLANILSLAADVIQILLVLGEGVVRLGSIFAGAIDLIKGFALGLIGLAQIASGDLVGGMESLRQSAELGRLGLQEIKDAFSNGDKEIGLAIGGVEHTISGGLKKIEKAAQKPEVKKSIDSALKPGDKDYVPEWNQKTDGISKAVQDGMLKAGIEGQAGAELVAKSLSPVGKTDTVNQTWKSVVDGVIKVVNDGARFVGEAGGLGGTAFVDSLRLALGLAPAEAGKAVQPVPRAVGAALIAGNPEVAKGAGEVVKTVSAGLQPMSPAAAQAANNAALNMRTGMTSMTDEARTGVNNTVAQTGRTPGEVQASMGNTSTLLTEAGRSIMNSLLDGLKAAWGAVQSFVADIAGWIRRNKGPISKDKKLLKPAGEVIMKGLHLGLVEGFIVVQRAVSGMASQIADSFQSGINWLDISSVPESLKNVSGTVTSNVTGSIDPADVTGIAQSVSTALEGWTVEIDQAGIAKLVNKENLRNRRR